MQKLLVLKKNVLTDGFWLTALLLSPWTSASENAEENASHPVRRVGTWMMRNPTEAISISVGLTLFERKAIILDWRSWFTCYYHSYSKSIIFTSIATHVPVSAHSSNNEPYGHFQRYSRYPFYSSFSISSDAISTRDICHQRWRTLPAKLTPTWTWHIEGNRESQSNLYLGATWMHYVT